MDKATLGHCKMILDILNEIFSEYAYDYMLRCKICGDRFTFKKEEIMLSKLIDHAKSHYIDKDLIKKEWIARDIIHLNYDSYSSE